MNYGVRESWLVDPVRCAVEAVNLEAGVDRRRVFDGRDSIESYVLPGLTIAVGSIFD